MIQCSRTALAVIAVTQVRASQLCVCALSLHVFTRGHSSWQYLKNIVAELHPATSYTNIIIKEYLRCKNTQVAQVSGFASYHHFSSVRNPASPIYYPPGT